MKNIIEKISWIPFNLLTLMKKNRDKSINLNFKNIGINKKFKFNLSSNDEGLSSQLRVFGFREPLNLEYYYKFVDSSDIVLDIGANIGFFTILSERAKKIICVEPLKQAIPILNRNISDNNLAEKTNVINAAVGKNGKLLIEVDKKLNLSKIVNEKNDNTYEVKSYELNDLVKKYKSNLLRLDVEGYEYEILYKKIPKNITKISLEFHTALLGDKKVKELMDYFEKEKFKVKFLIEDLPIRLYPYHNILKKTGLIKNVTYIKKNLTPKECLKYVNEGRKVKYIFLERWN
ncbi:hypothetical protein COU59_01815 [Candidatus Pacearchaeota archaeon CG10_big_fil_rev_8_21_14_0_10_34_12]|nr:MAG: hypothetical protein COU59_01815 [Candidatus Pacearchaeota archaeon CG10_big_fil_rev_8_21_14_0_10_34_12]